MEDAESLALEIKGRGANPVFFGPYLELLCFRDLARLSMSARVQWVNSAVVWKVLQDSAASPWRDGRSAMDKSEAWKAK